MNCTYCHGPVDDRPGHHWQRVAGWERKAQAEGRRSGSDIALRERQNTYACMGCIETLKLGVHPAQTTL